MSLRIQISSDNSIPKSLSTTKLHVNCSVLCDQLNFEPRKRRCEKLVSSAQIHIILPQFGNDRTVMKVRHILYMYCTCTVANIRFIMILNRKGIYGHFDIKPHDMKMVFEDA